MNWSVFSNWSGTGNASTYGQILSDTSYTFMGVYLTFIGLIAGVGNLTIIIVMIKNKQFRQPINLFVLSLAISDGVEGTIGYPFSASSAYAKRWLFGSIGCSFYGFLCFTCSLSNINTFVAVSYYRYLVLCKPEKAKQVRQTKWVLGALCIIWCYSLFWAVWPFFGWGSYTKEPFGTSCTIDWHGKSASAISYIILNLIFVLVIPTSLLVYFYVLVLRGIISMRGVANYQPERNQPFPVNMTETQYKKASYKMENVVTKTIFVTILLYLLAWLPYGVVSFSSTLGADIPPDVAAIPCMLAKSQNAYNAVVYITAHKSFRRSLLRMLGKKDKSIMGLARVSAENLYTIEKKANNYIVSYNTNKTQVSIAINHSLNVNKIAPLEVIGHDWSNDLQTNGTRFDKDELQTVSEQHGKAVEKAIYDTRQKRRRNSCDENNLDFTSASGDFSTSDYKSVKESQILVETTATLHSHSKLNDIPDFQRSSSNQTL